MTNEKTQHNTTASSERPVMIAGLGRLLVVVYGILALAATGRSFSQIATHFDDAPVAYLLSALAAVVYIVATVALVRRTPGWYRLAWATIVFEFLGVIAIGTVSLVDPALFPDDTVWSFYGRGYLFIPLVLPLLGMWWLARHRPVRPGSAGTDAQVRGGGTGV
ncbi:hypothetical protein GCM10027416_24370 [Okibacterium endophyticum]